MRYISKYPSPVGNLVLVSDGEHLTGILFDDKETGDCNLHDGIIKNDLAIFSKTKEWLDLYFSGKEPFFLPALSFENVSPFRKRVWEIMLTIPFGQTTTYGNIAKQIAEETGKRVSAQAVGGAVGHNAIPIIIPCHRVIGSNLSLTGYAGGIDKKIKLLENEGVIIK